MVRVDTQSDTEITAPDGGETTQKQLATDLGVEYRPTLILFDQGQEIARIDGMLYRYHFVGLLEYVGLGKYKQYPDSPFDYINTKTAELTAAGEGCLDLGRMTARGKREGPHSGPYNDGALGRVRCADRSSAICRKRSPSTRA